MSWINQRDKIVIFTCSSTTASANLVSASLTGWSAALTNRDSLKHNNVSVGLTYHGNWDDDGREMGGLFFITRPCALSELFVFSSHFLAEQRFVRGKKLSWVFAQFVGKHAELAGCFYLVVLSQHLGNVEFKMNSETSPQNGGDWKQNSHKKQK